MLPIAFNQELHICPSGCRSQIVRRGHYWRQHDQKWIQRFLCSGCLKSFSAEFYKTTYREKKPYLRAPIFMHLISSNSQRRTAILVGTTRTTVIRKFKRMGRLALAMLQVDNLALPKVEIFEFDDLETSCETKCKPLSVTLAVEYKTRRILGFSVSQMPAKGRLAMKALKKYGPRPDLRSQGRELLFTTLKTLVHETGTIKSDQNPHYRQDVKKHFPNHVHEVFKGRKPQNAGQGEMKKGAFDPLFTLNHTYAMLRANINRLVRETWCLTKRPERLVYHLALYAVYHNRYVIHHPSR
jgi:transposase-like protein